jgi:DNA-3-methyladenine glycosylase I
VGGGDDDRCEWGRTPEDYRRYHDDEWGMPVLDDGRLFEKLSLEGFQSGLSWLTILRKREAFRRAFVGFDPVTVAAYGPDDVARLLADASIVRHRGKIEATIANAAATLRAQEVHGSLAALVWAHEPEPGPPPGSLADLPSSSPESAALARALKGLGFRFLGPTTVYAAMQAIGVVNDHVGGCPARARCEAARGASVRPRR